MEAFSNMKIHPLLVILDENYEAAKAHRQDIYGKPTLTASHVLEVFVKLKGPVRLIKRVKIAHSFIFTVCVRSVLRYHFKLAYVILQTTVKEFFKTHF